MYRQIEEGEKGEGDSGRGRQSDNTDRRGDILSIESRKR